MVRLELEDVQKITWRFEGYASTCNMRSVQSGYGIRWRIEVAEAYGRGMSM
jgi:hypothetical protein